MSVYYPDVEVEHVRHEPGNGTCYRLVFTLSFGNLTVSWPDMRWSCGDFSPRNPPSAEWLRHTGRLNKADAVEVAAAAAAWCESISWRD